MDNRKQQKKEPWRIVVAIAAVVLLVKWLTGKFRQDQE